jgi:acyl dehydratase
MSSVETPGYVTDIASLGKSVGNRLGPTPWTEMTQQFVNEFADLTGDHNFIHVDVERSKQTPFGGTIAHGFLSLALLAPVTQLLNVSDAATSINYGLNKVRFPGPLRVGARYRGVAEIIEVSEVRGGVEAKISATLEVEDTERPAVVAESIVRFYA